MHGGIIPIDLDELLGDTLPNGRKGLIKYYDKLIIICKKHKNRWTIYGNKIDDKFIRNFERRRNELESKYY
tara:strand:+ start:195 stop:407 length:213 start_codon:yes stop_codon:yes gene_type:complete